MEKKDTFTKILAAAGTVLVGLPVAAPLIFGVMRFIESRRFRLDYLMPFELFPLILLGSGLLIWAAIRARSRLKLVSWGLGAVVGLVVIGQGVAMVSGLASGRIEPNGLWWTVVLIFMACAILGILAIAAGGILLLRDLGKKP